LLNEGKAVTEENLAAVTGKQVLEVLNEQNKTDGEKLADQLQKEADLAAEYAKRDREFQDETRAKLFAQIDDGKLDTFFTEREREAKQQEKLLDDFNENMKSATLARDALKTGMEALNETVKVIEKSVVAIAEYFGVGRETKAEQDASKIVIQGNSGISSEQLTRSIENIRL